MPDESPRRRGGDHNDISGAEEFACDESPRRRGGDHNL